MSNQITYISHSFEETFSFGKKLGESLNGGEVLALFGDLGAGKTALVKGVASGLGIKDLVNSPTFNIMKIYSVKKGKIKNFCHIDAYRLTNSKELLDIGVNDYLGKVDTVSVIEWAEKVKQCLNFRYLQIYLKVVSLNIRKIIIKNI